MQTVFRKAKILHEEFCIDGRIAFGVRTYAAETGKEMPRDAGFSAEYIWIDAGWQGESANDCPDEFTDKWSKHK